MGLAISSFFSKFCVFVCSISKFLIVVYFTINQFKHIITIVITVLDLFVIFRSSGSLLSLTTISETSEVQFCLCLIFSLSATKSS